MWLGREGDIPRVKRIQREYEGYLFLTAQLREDILGDGEGVFGQDLVQGTAVAEPGAEVGDGAATDCGGADAEGTDEEEEGGEEVLRGADVEVVEYLEPEFGGEAG